MSRFCVLSDFNPFVQSRWKERAKRAELEQRKKRKKRASQSSVHESKEGDRG